MTALAPTLQAFFTTRLGRERDASPHTVDSYRHAFRLLLTYAKARTGKDPPDLDLADLDADTDQRLSRLPRARTRPTAPAAATPAWPPSTPSSGSPPTATPSTQRASSRSSPSPKSAPEKNLRSFLTEVEMDALLAAPDRSTWIRQTQPRPCSPSPCGPAFACPN